MEYVDVARVESERGSVVLRERREDGSPAVLELRVNGAFVMDTRETGSERALANLALGLVEDPRDVLVGGLGLGFTAREVLNDRRVEKVVVVEIEDALIGWMTDGTIKGGPALLADQRLAVVHGDIAQAVAEATGTYDLVLLDIDNGPGQLVHQGNAAVYRAPFLAAVRNLLGPSGALVVWAADEAPELEQTLRVVFGNCRRIGHPVELQGRSAEYLLYLSRAEGGAG